MFFQLGLPDTRGAKWMTDPSLTFSPMQLPHTSSVRVTGNTWLLKEAGDGMVDVVKDQTTKIRAWNIGQRSAPRNKKPAAAPQVFLQLADLEKDLQQLEAVLAGKDEIESEDYGGDDEASKAKPFGSALLFLAHLHRQGRTEIAAKLFPMTLAHAPSPVAAMDAAISGIANGRLDQLNKDWISKGDTAAYIKGLEALGAEFSRGWANRGAAMHLAGRLRQQKPSGKRSPEATKLASMLKALKPEELRKLPLNQNWFVAGGDGVPISNFNEISEMGEEVGEVDGEDEAEVQPPASNKNNKKGPLDLLFTEKKKQTAAALIELLDDTTFIRVIKQDYGNTYFSSDSSEEEKMMAAYQQMSRPYELGELAWNLLSSVVPNDYSMENNAEGRKDTATAWLQEIASMSDEQLAWQTMKTASGHYDPNFKTALKFLVENGGEETVVKLEDVFLDPAAWGGNFDGQDTILVQSYLKRIGSKAPTFGEKLKAVVIKKIDEQHASMLEHSGDNDGMKKMFETQKQSQLKQLDQVLKPRGLGEMLQELVALKDEEAIEMMEAIKTAISQAEFAEAEKQVYQAAAKSQSSQLKINLIQLLNADPLQPAKPKGDKPALPDSTTREALRVLLKDQSMALHDPYGYGASGMGKYMEVCDVTALAFTKRRFSEKENEMVVVIGMQLPRLVSAWKMSYAHALIDEKPLPTMPDAEKVPANESDALIKELAALPAGDIPAAFHAKPADQQAAIAKQLIKAAEWPAPLAAASFTITSVKGAAVDLINASQWKGRRFDEALYLEMNAVIEKAALQNSLVVSLQKEGVLGGLSLMVQTHNIQDMAPSGLMENDMFKIAGRPMPAVILSCMFTSGPSDNGVYCWGPLWKDEAQTKSWREENFKPMTADEARASKPEPEQMEMPNHPQILIEAIKQAFEPKAGELRPFDLVWNSSLVKTTPKSDTATAEPDSEN